MEISYAEFLSYWLVPHDISLQFSWEMIGDAFQIVRSLETPHGYDTQELGYSLVSIESFKRKGHW